MTHEAVQRFEKFDGGGKCIDCPRPDEAVYDECISVAGWVFAANRDPSTCRVRAWLDGRVLGETQLLFARSDVSEFLSISPETPTGFRFLGRMAQPASASFQAAIRMSASWAGDATEYELGQVSVHLVPASLQNRPHGGVIFPAQSALLHRKDVYGSGPPILDPGAEMLRLILSYLSPGGSIVDVGCGAGAYGPVLITAGHQWIGLELNPHCLELLAQRGLPFRKMEESTERFPCANQEFDEAICIEVLEHIGHPEEFVREISRIVRKRAVFSVPNIEIIPFLNDWEAVPWHMLEADHKNFFTRTNLRELLTRHFSRVEVFTHIEHPLRTRDNIPLHVHLLAVADK